MQQSHPDFLRVDHVQVETQNTIYTQKSVEYFLLSLSELNGSICMSIRGMIESERVLMESMEGLTTFTNKTLNPDALAYLNHSSC